MPTEGTSFDIPSETPSRTVPITSETMASTSRTAGDMTGSLDLYGCTFTTVHVLAGAVARVAQLMSDTTKLTADAHARVTEEIERLEGEGRREIAARIKTAREWGDLKENAEYHAAQEE